MLLGAILVFVMLFIALIGLTTTEGSDDKARRRGYIFIGAGILLLTTIGVLANVLIFVDFKKEPVKVSETKIEYLGEDSTYIKLVEGEGVTYTEITDKGRQLKTVHQDDVYIKYGGDEAKVEEYNLEVSTFVRFLYGSRLNGKEYIITLPEHKGEEKG